MGVAGTVVITSLSELDALCDVEIMGNPKFDAESCKEVPGTVTDHWEYGPDGEGPFYRGPAYSSDANAMMVMVGRMVRETTWFECDCGESVGWDASFNVDADDRKSDELSRSGATLQIAACRAALAMRGIEIDLQLEE